MYMYNIYIYIYVYVIYVYIYIYIYVVSYHIILDHTVSYGSGPAASRPSAASRPPASGSAPSGRPHHVLVVWLVIIII